MTQDRQTARAVAQSLRDTLADCATPRPRPHHRFSMVENRPRRPPAPTCVQKHPSDRVSQDRQTARAVAPSLSETPKDCARQVGTVPSPILDGRKSTASTARANMCASILVTGYPKIGKLPAPSRHRFPRRPKTVRGKSAQSHHRFSMVENRPRRPPAPTCVQAS
jgi:hypothetical protein